MKKNKASILIISLWIVALLSLMAMGLGFRSSLEVRLASYNLDSLRARYLAKAGIAQAKMYLSKDSKPYDSLYQCGIELKQESLEDIFSRDLGQGSFSVYYRRKGLPADKNLIWGLIDEERKININLSKFGQNKEEFRKALVKLSPDLTVEVVNAIIDWQDLDSEPTLPGGAEDSQYQFLDNPYECSDQDFKMIEELLLVKGINSKLFREVESYLTVYGEGKVNINTASETVLNAIINNEAGEFSRLVDGIVNFRNDSYFTNIEEVALLAQSNQELIRLNDLAGRFIFKSSNFRIRSHSKINKISKVIDCILKKEPHSGELEVVYYNEG